MPKRASNQTQPARPVLMVVSGTPPPFSGPEIMTAHLLNSAIKDRYQLVHYNISKQRDVNTRARFDLVNVLYGLGQPLEMIGLMARHRPQLVYTNLAQTLGGFLRYAGFILIAALFRTPVIVRVMGDGFNHFYARSSPPLRRLLRRVLAAVDGYIVRAEVLKRQFDGLVPPDHLHVVHSGIDVHEFDSPRQRSADDKQVRVLFVGYLTQAKGAHDLLRAVPAVVAAYPDVRFLLMGPRLDIERNITYHDSPQSNNQVLDELLARPDIAPHVELLGTQSGAAKVTSFVNADLFVLPSYSEAFPTVVLEAMAAGLPVIATPVGVLPEAFDARSIAFVPTGDVDALAHALIRLLHAPETRAQMGSFNRHLAETSFDLDSHAQQVAQVFDRYL